MLDVEQATHGDPQRTMLRLLEEAHGMEAMRARLLAVTAAQTRAAGFAPGTEQAGLPRLVALVDQERSAAQEDRELLRARLKLLHRHPVRLHGFETFAAARAAALVEHLRSYKVIRDVRDLLAADQLEIATYALLAAAAGRAGDHETANLAHQPRAKERTAAARLTAELDSALQIALLAEWPGRRRRHSSPASQPQPAEQRFRCARRQVRERHPPRDRFDSLDLGRRDTAAQGPAGVHERAAAAGIDAADRQHHPLAETSSMRPRA